MKQRRSILDAAHSSLPLNLEGLGQSDASERATVRAATVRLDDHMPLKGLDCGWH